MRPQTDAEKVFGIEIWLKALVKAYVPYPDHRQEAVAEIEELVRIAKAGMGR